MKKTESAEVLSEKLVRAAWNEGKRSESQKKAIKLLRSALTSKSAQLPLWLTTCARLRAHEAAPIVISIIASRTCFTQEAVLAAVDAGRGVIALDDYATRRHLSAKFALLADEYLAVSPFVAARALMTAVMFKPVASWTEVIARMAAWPPKHLQPALREICTQATKISPFFPSDRASADELRNRAMDLYRSLCASSDRDAHYVLADLMELLAALSTPAEAAETATLLVEAFSSGREILMAGAAAGMKRLGRTSCEAITRAMSLPEGAELLRAALRVPDRSADAN